MQGAHLFDLPPELIVRILKEFDEQSLGRLKTVSRYLNALIEKHRGALAKQSIYMAIFKQDELIVERFLSRCRWEDYKYAISGPHIDPSILRQLDCALIDTMSFQMRISDELAEELARRLSALKSSVFRLSFVRCHLSAKAFIALISALKPQQLTIEFDLAFDGISSRVLCDHVSFREMEHLNLVNSRLTDCDLRRISAEHLTVYEKSELTLEGLRQLLLDWYNGKRSIQDYHLSISERIVPERLFHGLTTRRRSIIAWELRNFNSVLHVSIIGPGVSIAKVFNLLECS